MAKYVDYYSLLGVARNADSDAIQKAYRTLARKLHPDVSKAPDAAKKFAEVNEAYEVLKDPEKRKLYDQLGADWKSGQDFKPPPGWSGKVHPGKGRGRARGAGGSGGGVEFDFGEGGAAGFSDFFESIFGSAGSGFRGHGRGSATAHRTRVHAPEAVETPISVSVRDLAAGATKTITIQFQSPDLSEAARSKTIEVRLPRGTTEGSAMRLSGQGPPDAMTGEPADLLLRVHVEDDGTFRIAEPGSHDVVMALPVSPWEAALGAKVTAATLDKDIVLSIPAGAQHGQRLRVRSGGLPKRQNERGDLLVEIRIVIPKQLTEEEKTLLRQLGEVSNFDPRRT